MNSSHKQFVVEATAPEGATAGKNNVPGQPTVLAVDMPHISKSSVPVMPDDATARIRDMEPQFEAAWPTSRLRDTATTGQLCMLILYLPLGLMIFFGRCILIVIWLVRGLPGGVTNLWRWGGVMRKVHYADSLSWDAIRAASSRDDMTDVILALDHHTWWETPGLDPQQATPASIVDQRMASSFCNKLLPPNIIYLTQKLVHAVKTRIFELEHGTSTIYPVAVSYRNWLLSMIHMRKVSSGYAGDLFWLMMMPGKIEVEHTVLPPPPAWMSPADATQWCNQSILAWNNGHALPVAAGSPDSVPKGTDVCTLADSAISIDEAYLVSSPKVEQAVHYSNGRGEWTMNALDTFDKRAWRKHVGACMHSRYRRRELQFMGQLQRCSFLLYPAVTLHYLLQETGIVVMGAASFMSRWQQPSLLVIIMSVVWTLCITVMLKYGMRLPRPAWVRGDKLTINPYKLRVPMKQYDYTFPSGHSSFMASCWASYAWLSVSTPDLAFNLPWWMHLVLGGLTLGTGISRMFLSLHFPKDIVCGWALAATTSYIWVMQIAPRWAVCSPGVQMGITAASAVAIAAFCSWRTLKVPRHHRANLKRWSDNVGHALRSERASTWLLLLATWVVSGTVRPQLTWIGRVQPLGYCISPAAWLRVVFVAVGLAGMGVLALLFGVLPRLAAAKLQKSRAANLEAGTGAQSAPRSRLSVCLWDAQYFFCVCIVLEWATIGTELVSAHLEHRTCG